MEKIEETSEGIKLTVEKVIDIIREVRNGLIKDFLNDDNLQLYFKNQYNKSLTPVKQEFVKRALKDLESTPLDLTHYASLIKQVREFNSASITEKNQDLFYQELELIFKKYNY